MTEREKLIELLVGNLSARCSFCEEFMTEMCSEHCSDYGTLRAAERMTDYLLANGVTIPVRCGECKCGMEYEFSNGNVHFACCDIEEDGTVGFARAVNENGFCDLVERRAENG